MEHHAPQQALASVNAAIQPAIPGTAPLTPTSDFSSRTSAAAGSGSFAAQCAWLVAAPATESVSSTVVTPALAGSQRISSKWASGAPDKDLGNNGPSTPALAFPPLPPATVLAVAAQVTIAPELVLPAAQDDVSADSTAITTEANPAKLIASASGDATTSPEAHFAIPSASGSQMAGSACGATGGSRAASVLEQITRGAGETNEAPTSALQLPTDPQLNLPATGDLIATASVQNLPVLDTLSDVPTTTNMFAEPARQNVSAVPAPPVQTPEGLPSAAVFTEATVSQLIPVITPSPPPAGIVSQPSQIATPVTENQNATGVAGKAQTAIAAKIQSPADPSEPARTQTPPTDRKLSESERAPATASTGNPGSNPAETVLTALNSIVSDALSRTSSEFHAGLPASANPGLRPSAGSQVNFSASPTNTAPPIGTPASESPVAGTSSKTETPSVNLLGAASTPVQAIGPGKNSQSNAQGGDSPDSSGHKTAPVVPESSAPQSGLPQPEVPAPASPVTQAMAGQPAAANSMPKAEAGVAAGPPESHVNPLPAGEPATAVPPGPVHMAQIVNQAAQSEMRVALNTSAFGSVEVRTVVHANDVGVLIGSEKGDLRALLTNELPAIANSLQQQSLRLNQVNFHQGFAFSNNSSSGGESQSRAFAFRPATASLPADVLGEARESTDSQLTGHRSGLSVLA